MDNVLTAPTMPTMSNFDLIPPELVIEIARVDVKSYHGLVQTCKKILRILRAPHGQWKNFFGRRIEFIRDVGCEKNCTSGFLNIPKILKFPDSARANIRRVAYPWMRVTDTFYVQSSKFVIKQYLYKGERITIIKKGNKVVMRGVVGSFNYDYTEISEVRSTYGGSGMLTTLTIRVTNPTRDRSDNGIDVNTYKLRFRNGKISRYTHKLKSGDANWHGICTNYANHKDPRIPNRTIIKYLDGNPTSIRLQWMRGTNQLHRSHNLPAVVRQNGCTYYDNSGRVTARDNEIRQWELDDALAAASYIIPNLLAIAAEL